ncbi:hypothetical protein ACG10_19385 [Azotobacter chroococcum]|nr:hypothetical protein ACG10_19385 [Azotobacter chroococcum]
MISTNTAIIDTIVHDPPNSDSAMTIGMNGPTFGFPVASITPRLSSRILALTTILREVFVGDHSLWLCRLRS